MKSRWLGLVPLLFACMVDQPGAQVPLPRPDAGAAATADAPAPTQPLTRAELDAILAPPGARLTAPTLLARTTVTTTEPTRIDPTVATRWDTLQASSFALNAAEQEALATRGFVLSGRQSRRHFLQGYADLYHADLPVYVTADAILHALHAGFDSALMSAEENRYAPALSAWIAATLNRLHTTPGLSAATVSDLSLHLSLASALLQARPPTDPEARSLYQSILAAHGTREVTLYGAVREVDFSQFQPRGHYDRSPALSQYFRAMMWLGREGFRVVDVDIRTGARFLQRRQLYAVRTLSALQTPALTTLWQQLEDSLAGIVGEADDFTLTSFGTVLRRLASTPLEQHSDAAILAVVDEERGTIPRVASVLLRHENETNTALPVAFSVSPQRYTPDALVLSNVVFNRVAGGTVLRMMPDPLDAAYASFGNDFALTLLGPSLAQHDYAAELHESRVLVDAHEEGFWRSSLAMGWLDAIRALSPRVTSQEAGTVPTVMQTAAWQTRVLNTQMASWAEYRHDMILAARQSYTLPYSCSYPDAYVDPYPSFYAAVRRWAERGGTWAASLPPVAAGVMDDRAELVAWFGRVRVAMGTLGAMATKERTGVPFSTEEIAWVNQAVRVQRNGCAATDVLATTGWYTDLFRISSRSVEDASLVADVHTQPTDAAGTEVGRILHVGTSAPKLMVAVVENCTGPHLYAGFVSSYAEATTEHYERLTDGAWRSRAHSEVPWMAALVRGQ